MDLNPESSNSTAEEAIQVDANESVLVEQVVEKVAEQVIEQVAEQVAYDPELESEIQAFIPSDMEIDKAMEKMLAHTIALKVCVINKLIFSKYAQILAFIPSLLTHAN